MDLAPCPHISTEEHVRACIVGSVACFLFVGLLNFRSMAGQLLRFFSSSSSSSAKKKISRDPVANRYKMNLIDHLVGAVLVVIMAINVYTRVSRGVAHWLVQVLSLIPIMAVVWPCHYLTAMLIGVTYSSSTDGRLFWLYLYAHWQGYFAFFGGDMSWYVTKVELYAFWLQHALMTLVPFYYLVVGRFNTRHSSFVSFLTIYAITIAYHSMVLIPMSYWTMTDFDNMLCPFPGAEDLVGLWWREAMAIGSLPFAAVVCYLPGLLSHWLHSLLLRSRKYKHYVRGKE